MGGFFGIRLFTLNNKGEQIMKLSEVKSSWAQLVREKVLSMGGYAAVTTAVNDHLHNEHIEPVTEAAVRYWANSGALPVKGSQVRTTNILATMDADLVLRKEIIKLHKGFNCKSSNFQNIDDKPKKKGQRGSFGKAVISVNKLYTCDLTHIFVEAVEQHLNDLGMKGLKDMLKYELQKHKGLCKNVHRDTIRRWINDHKLPMQRNSEVLTEYSVAILEAFGIDYNEHMKEARDIMDPTIISRGLSPKKEHIPCMVSSNIAGVENQNASILLDQIAALVGSGYKNRLMAINGELLKLRDTLNDIIDANDVALKSHNG